MKNKEVLDILNFWADKYLENVKNNVHFKLSNDLSIGYGMFMHQNDDDSYHISIGISPLSKSLLARNRIVSESNFVRIGITMFHEFGHYDQATDREIAKEILLSDLSKYGNNQYYKDNWSHMPHEIDAEFTGVMSMWNKLEEISDEADEIMLEQVSNKAKSNYMIKYNGNFQSKNQIETLFDIAYDRSLITKRELSSQFLRSNDEIAQMITDDDNIIHMEYYPFYYQIQTAKTGREMDIKIASLVSYIHPELQKSYPNLNFSELDPLLVFGMSMPETKEAILSRISKQDNGSILYEYDEKEFADAIIGMSVQNDSLNK